jgi:hypothetical protein
MTLSNFNIFTPLFFLYIWRNALIFGFKELEITGDSHVYKGLQREGTT